MSEPDASLPTPREWSRVGVCIDDEFLAGKQSSVFAATVDGRNAAVKLTDGRLADPELLAERMRVAEALAADSAEVTAPIRIDGVLVHRIGDWLLTATPFVAGRRPDLTDAADAQGMGRTLARLHDALARLGEFSIPPVAALDVPDGAADRGDWQLLHGDFSDQNAIVTPTGLRIFDFDDCGYGPVAYDLANSLYMVLFDSEVNDHPDRYDAFRPPFLGSYADTSGHAVDHAAIDSMIDRRVSALGRWLDDLASAPIGIRTSSVAWRRTLGEFVASRTDPSPLG